MVQRFFVTLGQSDRLLYFENKIHINILFCLVQYGCFISSNNVVYASNQILSNIFFIYIFVSYCYYLFNLMNFLLFISLSCLNNNNNLFILINIFLTKRTSLSRGKVPYNSVCIVIIREGKRMQGKRMEQLSRSQW